MLLSDYAKSLVLDLGYEISSAFCDKGENTTIIIREDIGVKGFKHDLECYGGEEADEILEYLYSDNVRILWDENYIFLS